MYFNYLFEVTALLPVYLVNCLRYRHF